jgi:hypothetical protein
MIPRKRFAEGVEQSPEQSITDRTLNEIAPAGCRQVVGKVLVAAPFSVRPSTDVDIGIVPVGALPPDDEESLIGTDEMILKGGENRSAADRDTRQ